MSEHASVEHQIDVGDVQLPLFDDTPPEAPEAAPAEDAPQAAAEGEPVAEAQPEEETQAAAPEETTEPAPEPVKAEAEPAKPAEPAAPPEPDPNLVEAAQFGQQAYNMLQEDADLRRVYLQGLRKRGQLPQNMVAELEALEGKPAAQAVAPPPPTRELPQEVKTQIKSLMSEGREDQAMLLLQQHTVLPEIHEIRAVLEREKQEKVRQAQAAEMQRATERIRGEMESLAKSYPDLVQVDAAGRPVWKDKAFLTEMRQIGKYVSPDESLLAMAEYALFKLGRQGQPQKKAQAQAAKAAAIKPAAKVAAPAPKDPTPAPGEYAVQIEIE